MRPTLTVLALATLLAAGCSQAQTPAPDPAAMPVLPPPAMADAATPAASPDADADAAAQASDIDRILAGDWRPEANTARDKYRHPRETLAFFGVRPDQTLIEIWPGGGWYTEVLAPLVREQGQYIGIVADPAKADDERGRASGERNVKKLRDMLAARPEVYGDAQLREVDPAAPVLGEPGSADIVLTFRNAHNWVMDGTEAAMFKSFFDVLKPGGTLGVVDHRARPGQPPAEMKSSGYLPEAHVIALAQAAGFELAGKSEINANPADTRDYPDGVWTLPPRLAKGDVDRAKYLAIGESDRMTLRFTKPTK